MCDLTDDCGDNTDETGLFCEEHPYMQSTFEQTSHPFGEFEPPPPAKYGWQRRSAKTATPGSGATMDHTLYDDVGHYLFINSSQDVPQDEKAELVSKTFKPGYGDDNDCEIIFYYHMHGPATGSLKLSILPKNGEQRMLWAKSGDQGNTWHRQYLVVENTTEHGPYNVIFEAEVTEKNGGDIALDDVVFTYNCKLQNDDTDTTTQPPDVGISDCNFEAEDLCGWHVDEELNVTDRFHFERTNGDNLGIAFRPDSDHNGDTKGNFHKLKH